MCDAPKSYNATFAVPPELTRLIVEDRTRGHRHTLSAFPDDIGAEARSKLSLLWHLDEATHLLSVRSSTPPVNESRLGTITSSTQVAPPSTGDHLRLDVALSCIKTPPAAVPPELRAALKADTPTGKGRAYRSRPVIVPEPERDTWARARLAKAGFDVHSITIGKLAYASLGSRDRGIPYVEITAEASAADGATSTKSLVGGLGRGKNYGLGLIRLRG